MTAPVKCSCWASDPAAFGDSRDREACAVHGVTAPRRFTNEEMLEEAATLQERCACAPGEECSQCVAAAMLRQAAAEGQGWQPIDTRTPRLDRVMFWTVPGPGYRDGQGRAITTRHTGLHIGTYGSWSSLLTATHWMPLPVAPTATSTEPTPPSVDPYGGRVAVGGSVLVSCPDEPPVAPVKRCGDGPCKWFVTGHGWAQCEKWRDRCQTNNGIDVPADGSGFCHLHQPQEAQ